MLERDDVYLFCYRDSMNTLRRGAYWSVSSNRLVSVKEMNLLQTT